VVISEDLDEVMTICDRVLVMYEGRVVGDVNPRETSREAIGLLMAGTVATPTRCGIAPAQLTSGRRRPG
jgi:ABC-type sugar transport system ATPase subunit